MAATKVPTAAAAALVAALLLAFVTVPAMASYMTAWGGPGCNNRAERYSACGCSSINQNGGYEFVYTGQTAALYNQPGCRGVAHTRFGNSAGACSGFGWRSIFIQC